MLTVPGDPTHSQRSMVPGRVNGGVPAFNDKGTGRPATPAGISSRTGRFA